MCTAFEVQAATEEVAGEGSDNKKMIGAAAAVAVAAGVGVYLMKSVRSTPPSVRRERNQMRRRHVCERCEGARTNDGCLTGLPNQAFVFVKPHACTDAAKALVKAELQKRGITIVTEGGILGSVIGASIEP
jgi:hypothetical protein